MNTELEAAYQTIPGYTEAAQTAATLDARYKQLRSARINAGINPAFTAQKELAQQITAAAGDQLPDDLTAHDWGPAWQNAVRRLKEDLLFQAVNEATNQAEQQRRHLITQGAGQALQTLDARLQRLLADIRTSRADDQHTTTYAAIRQAQRAIFTQALLHSCTRGQLNTVGEMADLYEHWPRWTPNGKPGSPAPGQPAPWTRHDSDPDKGEYTTAYLQWAADNSVRLWVPTFPQMQAADNRDSRLREQQDIHRQAVNQGSLPPSRFTIPDELSVNTMLVSLNYTEGLAHV